MGKISPVSAKYIVHAAIQISGIVDRPDVIGAIFGQTEGLLGTDLELRELQRSGRIGRIEVEADTKSGKTIGEIIIPSSLDKAETAIVAAALEVIQRIGPCNAKIKVEKIEDVRISKRKYVVARAKELLKELVDTTMPDSQELADEVTYSVRVMEITDYGRDKLPAGPAIDEGDEVLIVEGRADVINLLKHGFKNAIALNGTSVPETIKELSKHKTITAFVDGDRGGDLILKELFAVAEIDFVAKAPDGKEVEEITKKEIHKSLRSKISAEQAQLELKTSSRDSFESSDSKVTSSVNRRVESRNDRNETANRAEGRDMRRLPPRPMPRRPQYENRTSQQSAPATVSADAKTKFGSMLEDLIGTRGAYILDRGLNIMGKVPFTELLPTLKGVKTGVYAVIFDGTIESDLVEVAEKTDVKYLVGMDSKFNGSSRVVLITATSL